VYRLVQSQSQSELRARVELYEAFIVEKDLTEEFAEFQGQLCVDEEMDEEQYDEAEDEEDE